MIKPFKFFIGINIMDPYIPVGLTTEYERTVYREGWISAHEERNREYNDYVHEELRTIWDMGFIHYHLMKMNQ